MRWRCFHNRSRGPRGRECFHQIEARDCSSLSRLEAFPADREHSRFVRMYRANFSALQFVETPEAPLQISCGPLRNRPDRTTHLQTLATCGPRLENTRPPDRAPSLAPQVVSLYRTALCARWRLLPFARPPQLASWHPRHAPSPLPVPPTLAAV